MQKRHNLVAEGDARTKEVQFDASGSGLEDYSFYLLDFLAMVRNVSFELLKPDVHNLKLRVNHFEPGVQQLFEVIL